MSNDLLKINDVSVQRILNALSGATVVVDEDGKIVALNDAWKQFCMARGVAAVDAYLSQNYLEICTVVQGQIDDDATLCQQGIRDVLEGIQPSFRFDYQCELEGKRQWLMMTVSPLTEAYGGALISHLDITESKQIEVKFEQLLESPFDAMMMVDERGVIKRVNAQMEDVFGYQRRDLIGQKMSMLIPPRYRKLHKRHQAQYFAQPAARTMGTGLELYALHKNGHEFPVEISLTPLETGDSSLIAAAIRDISEQKLAEAQVAHLGDILEDSLNEIYFFDARSLCFTLVNKGGRDNLGYSMEELSHLTPVDIKPDFNLHDFEALLKPLRKGEKTVLQFMTRHQRKNGSAYPVDVHLQLFAEENPPIFVAIIMDITERKKVEQALQDSQQRVALHVEHTPLAVIEWDVKDNTITAWNPAAERVFGYCADDVVGKEKADIIVSAEISPQLQHVYSGDIDLGGFRSTNKNIAKDGRVLLCEWYNTPLKNERGEVTRVAALAMDITARQRALESLLTAQEEERARISRDLHDQVGQSLTAMLLGINAAAENPDKEHFSQLKDLTSTTLEEVRRISRDLRPALLDELGFEVAIKRFARDLAEQRGIAIDVLVRLPNGGQRSAVSSEEIVVYRVVQEALTNVVRHAEAKHASLIITSSGNQLQVIIEDDGVGFDINGYETSDHVGIAGMKERLELLGGSLNIESKQGQGTTINAKLPLQSALPS